MPNVQSPDKLATATGRPTLARTALGVPNRRRLGDNSAKLRCTPRSQPVMQANYNNVCVSSGH